MTPISIQSALDRVFRSFSSVTPSSAAPNPYRQARRDNRASNFFGGVKVENDICRNSSSRLQRSRFPAFARPPLGNNRARSSRLVKFHVSSSVSNLSRLVSSTVLPVWTQSSPHGRENRRARRVTSLVAPRESKYLCQLDEQTVNLLLLRQFVVLNLNVMRSQRSPRTAPRRAWPFRS